MQPHPAQRSTHDRSRGFDQAYSCNDEAEKILVRPATIEVTLNAKGRQDLFFSGDIRFEVPDSLAGWANALGIRPSTLMVWF
jgi:hypothetical protein